MGSTATEARSQETFDESQSNVGRLTILQGPPPDFTPSVAVMVMQVRTLHDFYANAPGPIGDRIRERNQKIRDVFGDMAERRRKGYEAFLCQVAGEKKTHCRAGDTCINRVHIEFPAETAIDAASLRTWGRGFKNRTPKIQGNRIVFHIGRAGNGSNTGGVAARGSYSGQAIATYLEAELDRVRAELARLGLPDDRAPEYESDDDARRQDTDYGPDEGLGLRSLYMEDTPPE